MERPGRKPLAQLGIVQPDGVISVPRPEAPACLRSDQADVWRFIVNSQSADWFRPETHRLLVQYCRCVTRSDYLEMLESQLIDSAGDLAALAKVQELSHKNTGQMNALSRSMRLTQQSSYSARKSKPAITVLPHLK